MAQRSAAWWGIVRAVAVAILLTGAATSLAAIPRVSTATAAVVYVLAVTGASALGGLFAGLATSILSLLALNFFFTEPVHTLTVLHRDDVIALAAFLVVSGIVGTMLSTVVDQRARAERREREALLLHRLGTRLLSGERLEDVVRAFATALTDLLSLARCEIRTELSSAAVVAEPIPSSAAGELEAIEMVAKGRRIGEVWLFPGPGRRLSDDERSVVRTFADQVGLALEAARLGVEAENARVEAETSKLRAALFSSVTHDLRTPLSSITAAATSLLDEDTVFAPEDRRDLLQTIRQEADRLNRLVGDLLDLARLRAGAVTPSRAPASIEETIEGVVSRLRPLLGDQVVELRFRDDLPDVPMDVVQIDQVLTNLMENAARFSRPETRIVVSATRWQEGLEVSIADRGPGIPAEDRVRVFEPFVRGQGEEAGTGLGLSISRAIVEAHGGKIWIKTTPGGGATVTFRLPLRMGADA